MTLSCLYRLRNRAVLCVRDLLCVARESIRVSLQVFQLPRRLPRRSLSLSFSLSIFCNFSFDVKVSFAWLAPRYAAASRIRRILHREIAIRRDR